MIQSPARIQSPAAVDGLRSLGFMQSEPMVRERLLDAACVVLADKDSATVRFPSNSVSFQTFGAAIHGRCLQFMTTNPDIDWSGRG